MKKSISIFAIILLTITPLLAQQRNRQNASTNRATTGAGSTRSAGNSPTASNNGTNAGAGLNTTTDQNYGAGTGAALPTTTDARSSTLTAAPPVKARKIKPKSANQK